MAIPTLTPDSQVSAIVLGKMKQIAETGKGPKEQIPSAGCSIKWKTN